MSSMLYSLLMLLIVSSYHKVQDDQSSDLTTLLDSGHGCAVSHYGHHD